MMSKLHKSLFLLAFFMIFNVFSQKKVWDKDVLKGKFNGHPVNLLEKENSQVLKLNFNEFKNQIVNAPLRGVNTNKSETIINLPDEKGKIQSFRIFEAPVFAPNLSARFPEIKSYVGFGTDNRGAVLRMSVSLKGVNTMISYTDKPTVFMQPLEGEIEKYIVYNRLSKTNLPKEDFICATADKLVKENSRTNVIQRDANDQTLRKFRLAVSVNGEYTTFHGGTVAGALAAINTTMTRVNAVFETDMAITFELQDFPQLIYIDAATDPYSGSLSAWNVELQNTLTNEIGNAAYDIGHMFGASGGGGNAGCIGCVCVDDTASTTDENKGAGITSPVDGIPQGDTFDIDYVAHEIGHQMGALHTWSHSAAGGNANIEPGSGSTIMGYAGITGSDIQSNSDPYFSYYSIFQITDNVTNNRLCWQSNSPVALTNNPPNADAGADYIIPQGTAYVLRGVATDTDNSDTLMYCWEQNDDGVVTISNFGPTLTTGAMVRSLPPTTSSDRYIPKLSRVIAGQLTETNPTDGGGSDWETVSTVSRDLNFALTVRDREPTATGLNGQSSFDLMKVTVDASAGPFSVTSQNTAVTLDVGTTQTITWDKSSTDVAPINVSNVRIKLSIDGGVTFPIVLIESTPNDGTHDLVIPNNPTTSARIMVEAIDNIFYSVNSSSFIINSTTPTFVLSNNTAQQNACNSGGVSIDYILNLDFVNGFSEDVSFTTVNAPSGANISFSPSTINVDGNVTMTVSNFDGLTPQLYTISVTGTSATTSVTQTVDALLNVLDNNFTSLILTSPTDGATGVGLSSNLEWSSDANATSYDVEIATDNNFTAIVTSTSVTSNTYAVTGLMQDVEYFWRVKSKNDCGEGAFSGTYSFTTETCSVCSSSGNTSYQTSTTLVQFNTINNTSAKPSGYSDYTSISTAVDKEESYDLVVNVNTDDSATTQYTVHTVVWVDWNQDCDFDDAGETYDLGFATGTPDGPTSLSPLSIIIPNSAVDGNTIMRVSSRYNTDPTSCQTNFDGEVEDYTLEIINPTASLEDFAFEGFNLYPNPSNGEVNLTFDVVNTDEVKTELYDIRGRKVSQKTFKNVSSSFSEKLVFDRVSTGIYLLKIRNGGKQTTRKLIIK